MYLQIGCVVDSDSTSFKNNSNTRFHELAFAESYPYLRTNNDGSC